MQLRRFLFAATLLAIFAPEARADGGEVRVRGAYYKERSTRVAQPMLDARFDVAEESEVRAHALVDSITSASVASGSTGEPFTETRYEYGGSYLQGLGRFALGGGFRYSTEPDYKSLFFTVNGRADLAQRNTTLELALARGMDDISNESSQGGLSEPVTGQLDTTLASLSLSQVLTPELVGALTYDLSHLNGFQENPYRTVPAGGVAVPERVPEERWRHALFGSLRGFVPPTGSIVVGGYRFYADDWGITGHTPELRVIQELERRLFVHARYRYHWQTEADFYKEIYDTADPEMEPFLTDDEKLSRMTTHTIGVKLELGLGLLGFEGILERTRTEALVEYIVQDTHYGNAINAQLAVIVPFDY